MKKKNIKPGNKDGRPSIYNKKLADEICKRRETSSLLQLCKSEDMPDRATVYEWLRDETKKDFSDNYDKSANVYNEKLFEELTEIADDGTNDYMEKESSNGESFTVVNSEHIQRSRLRVDVRKWYLSKVLPKKYGEKLDLSTNGKDLPTPMLYALRHNDSNSKAE